MTRGIKNNKTKDYNKKINCAVLPYEIQSSPRHQHRGSAYALFCSAKSSERYAFEQI